MSSASRWAARGEVIRAWGAVDADLPPGFAKNAGCDEVATLALWTGVRAKVAGDEMRGVARTVLWELLALGTKHATPMMVKEITAWLLEAGTGSVEDFAKSCSAAGTKATEVAALRPPLALITVLQKIAGANGGFPAEIAPEPPVCACQP